MAVALSAGERTEFAPTGPDATRFRYVEGVIARYAGPPGRPVYDSVVIAGGKGITAWTLAARLARSAEFAGRVVVAGPPVNETRQLRDGVSIRGAAADFISYALWCGQAEFVRRISGPLAAGPPLATRQVTCMARKDGSGRWTFGPAGAWQGGGHGLDRPLMYGARNARVAATIREMLDETGVIDTDAAVTSLEHARSLAPGRRPLLINLTTDSTLFGGPATPVTRVTLASQMAFRPRREGLVRPLTSSVCLAPLVYRDGAVNVGYITPFADPLSPEASWYGLMVRPQRTAVGLDVEEELEVLTDEVLGTTSALGLEPVDPDETMFRGLIPAPPFGRRPRSAPGTLEMRRLCTPGAVAYYADGILGGVLGAVLVAESLLRGVDPEPVVDKALRKYAWWNDLLWLQTVRVPWLMAATVGHSRPVQRAALLYPHSWSVNHWASRA